MTAALALGAGAAYVWRDHNSLAWRTAWRARHERQPGLSTMTTPAQSARRADTHDVLDAARSWLDKDGRVALATVVGTWGSAPVRVGGQMAIAADGQFEGSVS